MISLIQRTVTLDKSSCQISWCQYHQRLPILQSLTILPAHVTHIIKSYGVMAAAVNHGRSSRVVVHHPCYQCIDWTSIFHTWNYINRETLSPKYIKSRGTSVSEIQHEMTEYFSSVQFSSGQFIDSMPQLNDRMTEQICRQWKRTKRHQGQVH